MANILLARAAHENLASLVNHERRKSPYYASPSAIGSGSGYKYTPKVKSKSGLVAVIPIIGSMSRYGDLCSYGTEDIGAWIMEANADPMISGIVLEINSPGGEVDGTELLGEIVAQSPKPIVSYVAGMAASAAYWVASQSREIIMESETSSEVGSIGVLSMHVDASVAYEKEGYKVTIIRSEGSENKALFNSIEPVSEEMIQKVRSDMKPIRDAFVGRVLSGRPQIIGDVYDGSMFNGKAAVKNKMANSIGYLGDAVRRVDILARKSS
jgi:protease-4